MRINFDTKFYDVDNAWREFMMDMPFIKFPADWEVQVIPPFAGATARFRVRLPSGKEKSIYADHWNQLGYMEYPYWEVYPYEGDTGRCRLDDIPELLRMIGEEDA